MRAASCSLQSRHNPSAPVDTGGEAGRILSEHGRSHECRAVCVDVSGVGASKGRGWALKIDSVLASADELHNQTINESAVLYAHELPVLIRISWT